MSIKHSLLALLAEGPLHGYELKAAFDEKVGSLWKLNIGQIYNTLRLLERDGFIIFRSEEHEGRGPSRKVYEITGTGRDELDKWIAEPVRKPRRLKDEFYIKLVITRMKGGDIPAMIWNQKEAYLQLLDEVNLMRTDVNEKDDPMTATMLDGAALHLEADINWLDRCAELFK